MASAPSWSRLSPDGLATTAITVLLKGPRATHVRVTVAREGVDQPITVDFIRDEIPRPSVSEAFWLRPGIAYVRVNQFKENTSKELEDNLKRLGEERIQGLVLDLRENPGGLLYEGIEVAGHFLKKDQVVVSDRGRVKPAKEYKARSNNGGKEYPVVVVVNRRSASAAEIVSGALQDHDRAWILGETTFGKGLVQSVYQLPDHTGLALTTAHFYTPSGRLIQRDYSHLSLYDYYLRKEGGTRNPDDVKMTDSGRTVYGGGGITPDEEYTTPKLDALEAQLYRNGLFEFTRAYFAKHPTAVPKGWTPDDATLSELRDY